MTLDLWQQPVAYHELLNIENQWLECSGMKAKPSSLPGAPEHCEPVASVGWNEG